MTAFPGMLNGRLVILSPLTSLILSCLLCGVRVTILTRRLLNVGPDRTYTRSGLGGLTLERLLYLRLSEMIPLLLGSYPPV